jgi:murein DD-endopeptidase / murein LD-carboxypeptidase
MDLAGYTSCFKKVFFIVIIASFASCRSGKSISKTEDHSTIENKSSSKKIENKYAQLLGVSEKEIDNLKLYSFIDEWYGVPYKYGGKDKKGIDCSNFASNLYDHIYNKSLSGSSASIFNQCKTITLKDLKEGDLLFFKIEKESISHIGVYLQNNKFVHATTKKGVMIDDLNEVYYKKYFYKAGRINN